MPVTDTGLTPRSGVLLGVTGCGHEPIGAGGGHMLAAIDAEGGCWATDSVGTAADAVAAAATATATTDGPSD